MSFKEHLTESRRSTSPSQMAHTLEDKFASFSYYIDNLKDTVKTMEDTYESLDPEIDDHIRIHMEYNAAEATVEKFKKKLMELERIAKPFDSMCKKFGKLGKSL